MPMDLENQKRLRDALHRRGSSKEDPKPLNEAAQRTSSMLEKWNLVWKDISDVVAEVAPQLAGKEGVTPDDQCEKVDLSMLPPEACTPPLFVEARIALTNLSERKKTDVRPFASCISRCKPVARFACFFTLWTKSTNTKNPLTLCRPLVGTMKIQSYAFSKRLSGRPLELLSASPDIS
jgi:hypothetical protein